MKHNTLNTKNIFPKAQHLKLGISLILLLGILSIVGCSETQGKSEPTKTTASADKNKSPDQTSSQKKQSKIVQIVFVGQKNACECTRTRIDNTWEVLQKTLKNWKSIDVERIQLDVEQDKADKYDDMQSMVVAPGLYFIDENKQLVTMLQGELTEKQIADVL